MELLSLRLPNDLELMARWFAEDGEAEDTLNHCLTYRRAYRHLLPKGAEQPQLYNNNNSAFPHAASAHCALACGTRVPERAAPPEAYLQPDPYLQAEPYLQPQDCYVQPEPVTHQPSDSAIQPDIYLQPEPVMQMLQPDIQQVPYRPQEVVMPLPVMPQPEPVMQMPQPDMQTLQPNMQRAPYMPQPEPVYMQQPQPDMQMLQPDMQMLQPDMQQASPVMQPDPYMQQQPAAWGPTPPLQMDYNDYNNHYDSMPTNDMEDSEEADKDEKSLGKKAIGIVSKTTTIFVIALMAVSIVVFLLPRILGMELRAVVSPSMEPIHPVGSVVVIRPRPFESIGIGDDITFVRDAHGTIVTHRVVARNAVERTLTTQGLTNAAPDAPVGYQNVIGVVWFSVPTVGYAFIWLEPTVNKVIVAIVIVAIWLALFLVEKAVSTQKKTEPEAASTIYT